MCWPHSFTYFHPFPFSLLSFSCLCLCLSSSVSLCPVLDKTGGARCTLLPINCKLTLSCRVTSEAPTLQAPADTLPASVIWAWKAYRYLAKSVRFTWGLLQKSELDVIRQTQFPTSCSGPFLVLLSWAPNWLIYEDSKTDTSLKVCGKTSLLLLLII